MRFFITFVPLALMSFFYGCGDAKVKVIENKSNIKTVLIPKPIDAKNADIIYDLDFINLEAKENSYFGFVSKMRVYQNRIYILDDRSRIIPN